MLEQLSASSLLLSTELQATKRNLFNVPRVLPERSLKHPLENERLVLRAHQSSLQQRGTRERLSVELVEDMLRGFDGEPANRVQYEQ